MGDERYRLSRADHDRILQRIWEDTIHGKSPSQVPTLYVLGGQPGAGKSQLIEISRQDSPGAVTINGDEFREYHPQAEEIFRKHDKDFAKMTDPDTREWTREVFDEAKARRYGIIFEGTMRTDQICETIKDFRSQGYRIVVRVAAVHEMESRAAIYQRYERQLVAFGTARFTDRASHDAAYAGMLKTLKRIEKEGWADTLEAYTRDGRCVFSSREQNSPHGVVEAVLEGRADFWRGEKSQTYVQNLEGLLHSMARRGERSEYLDDVRYLQHAANNETSNEKECQKMLRHETGLSKLVPARPGREYKGNIVRVDHGVGMAVMETGWKSGVLHQLRELDAMPKEGTAAISYGKDGARGCVRQGPEVEKQVAKHLANERGR